MTQGNPPGPQTGRLSDPTQPPGKGLPGLLPRLQTCPGGGEGVAKQNRKWFLPVTC